MHVMRPLALLLAAVVAVAVSTLQAAVGPKVQTGVAPSVGVRARSFRPGELVVVSLAGSPDTMSVELHAFGHEVPAHRVAPGTWRGLAGIDLDLKPADYELTATLDGVVATKRVQVIARAFPVRRLKVNPDFVNPPPEVAARIAEESRFIERAYASGVLEPLWQSPFERPVPHQANSRFGTRSVFNGEPRSPHGGTDFLSPAGTPVRAPNAGRIVAARDLYFAGQTVMIDHGAGVFSQLAHLSRIDVREGESVRPGQVVGQVGATGRVTGAHLHWAVRVAGARVDALSLLALLGDAPATAP
jgi:murein DD-endopeptidase MepM/ murein hydrolase activator NlpD